MLEAGLAPQVASLFAICDQLRSGSSPPDVAKAVQARLRELNLPHGDSHYANGVCFWAEASAGNEQSSARAAVERLLAAFDRTRAARFAEKPPADGAATKEKPPSLVYDFKDGKKLFFGLLFNQNSACMLPRLWLLLTKEYVMNMAPAQANALCVKVLDSLLAQIKETRSQAAAAAVNALICAQLRDKKWGAPLFQLAAKALQRRSDFKAAEMDIASLGSAADKAAAGASGAAAASAAPPPPVVLDAIKEVHKVLEDDKVAGALLQLCYGQKEQHKDQPDSGGVPVPPMGIAKLDALAARFRTLKAEQDELKAAAERQRQVEVEAELLRVAAAAERDKREAAAAVARAAAAEAAAALSRKEAALAAAVPPAQHPPPDGAGDAQAGDADDSLAAGGAARAGGLRRSGRLHTVSTAEAPEAPPRVDAATQQPSTVIPTPAADSEMSGPAPVDPELATAAPAAAPAATPAATPAAAPAAGTRQPQTRAAGFLPACVMEERLQAAAALAADAPRAALLATRKTILSQLISGKLKKADQPEWACVRVLEVFAESASAAPGTALFVSGATERDGKYGALGPAKWTAVQASAAAKAKLGRSLLVCREAVTPGQNALLLHGGARLAAAATEAGSGANPFHSRFENAEGEEGLDRAGMSLFSKYAPLADEEHQDAGLPPHPAYDKALRDVCKDYVGAQRWKQTDTLTEEAFLALQLDKKRDYVLKLRAALDYACSVGGQALIDGPAATTHVPALLLEHLARDIFALPTAHPVIMTQFNLHTGDLSMHVDKERRVDVPLPQLPSKAADPASVDAEMLALEKACNAAYNDTIEADGPGKHLMVVMLAGRPTEVVFVDLADPKADIFVLKLDPRDGYAMLGAGDCVLGVQTDGWAREACLHAISYDGVVPGYTKLSAASAECTNLACTHGECRKSLTLRVGVRSPVAVRDWWLRYHGSGALAAAPHPPLPPRETTSGADEEMADSEDEEMAASEGGSPAKRQRRHAH